MAEEFGQILLIFVAIGLGNLTWLGLIYWKYRYSIIFRIFVVIIFAMDLSLIALILFRDVVERGSSIFWGMFVSLTLLLFIALLTMFRILLFNTISTPLKAVSKGSKRIAKGDLTLETIKYTKKDEIGDLSQAFEDMINFLTPIIQKISYTGEILTSFAQEMASSAEEINASSVQITTIAQQLSNGAQRQMEQVEGSLKQAETLKIQFEDKSQSIERASELIENIANQVNILALNASIEAARAGDYGRGFAVVADNIRRLSHETKQSLEDVNHIITDLRSSLACSITEIITSIQKVASVAKDSAASAEETNASTEEQTATIEQLSASAQQMSNLGEDLMVLVKQFKLD